jgi:hypothetical protein
LPCRLDSLVQATDHLGLLKYAVTHLGEGVDPKSINWRTIVNSQQLALQRYLTVLREQTDPRIRKQKLLSAMAQRRAELIGRRDEQIRKRQEKISGLLQTRYQLQLDLAKLARLEKMEQFELFLHQIHLQGTIIVVGKLKRLHDLARVSPEGLRSKLSDQNPEMRWMAIQVAGVKRYPMESDLIGLLSDQDNSVRQAARQALIRISRGNDFGPAVKANKTERQRSISRWKQWWALQDSHPRRQLLRLTDQKETGSQGKE